MAGENSAVLQSLLATEVTKTPIITEDVAQNAVNETGFGKFNLKIMAVCGLIYMNIGFGYNSLGLIVPSAACDFDMTTVDKSRLSVASALGMMSGAYVWGCMADLKGRKFSLIVALLLHGSFDALSAVISNYWLFIATKFFSGLGLSGQLALIFAYLGEFQPTNVRNRILSWMEIPWVLGYIIVPSWVIIPLEFEYQVAHLKFHSWNLFMLICSMPAIVIAISMIFFPKTPKYLAECGQYAELLEVLERMYSENNNKPKADYTEKISQIGDVALNEFVRLARMGIVADKKKKSCVELFTIFWRQTVTILRPPYLNRTLIVGTVLTSLMSTYFSMVMWLPEVFNRFATFETLYPDARASVCTVSAALRHNDSYDDASTATLDVKNRSVICDMGISTNVYMHSMILGLACIPTALWLPLFVERLGYVFHLVFGSFIGATVIFGLFFVDSSLQNLVLSCIFEAVASICITAMLCMLVQLYPTNLRVIAAAFLTFVGRLGAFTGNAFFGYLIDNHCVLLISFMAGQLLLSGILSIFIPREKK